jgi:hypothetical protein
MVEEVSYLMWAAFAVGIVFGFGLCERFVVSRLAQRRKQ